MKKRNGLKGWAALAVFVVTCVLLGQHLMLNRALNLPCLPFGSSVVIVVLMNLHEKGDDADGNGARELPGKNMKQGHSHDAAAHIEQNIQKEGTKHEKDIIHVSELALILACFTACSGSSAPAASSSGPAPAPAAPAAPAAPPAPRNRPWSLCTPPRRRPMVHRKQRDGLRLAGVRPNLIVRLSPGSGIENAKAMGRNEADFAMTHVVTTLNAMNGNDPFDHKIDNIRWIMAMAPTAIQIWVPTDSDIQSLADFKDKRVGLGKIGNLQNPVILDILKSEYGITPEPSSPAAVP
jgi:hypothetical protein